MPVIKRYSNRKLYDTDAKQYITLEGIAELIQQGEEVQVIDNATGEDLTAVTLTQVIFEQEKKQSGFIPRALLSSLIQAGGNRFSAIQRTLSSPLAYWHQMDEEIKRRIQALVSKGELTEGEGKSLIDKLLSQGLFQHEEHQISTKDLEEYIAEHEIPTQKDLQSIMSQLEELSAKLDEISQTGG